MTKPVERVKEEKPPPDAIPLKTRKSKKIPAPEASDKATNSARSTSWIRIRSSANRRRRFESGVFGDRVRAASGRGRTPLRASFSPATRDRSSRMVAAQLEYRQRGRPNSDRTRGHGAFDLMRDGTSAISNFPRQRHFSLDSSVEARHPGFSPSLRSQRASIVTTPRLNSRLS